MTITTHSYPTLPKATHWRHAAVLQRYSGHERSLADWAFNPVIGCCQACRFCNVPQSTMRFQKQRLSLHGIEDAVQQWGEFMFVRDWDENEFLDSVDRAENTARQSLSTGGHRAVLFSSATDAYQTIRGEDTEEAGELNYRLRWNCRRALELILANSTLNVRIHTRCSAAMEDFSIFQKFGSRLMFGVSVPTLREDLSRFYEPNCPLPSERLEMLRLAKAMGIRVFVIMSPIFPECSATDIRDTLNAVKEVDPWTIFCEPVRLRKDELARVESHAKRAGFNFSTSAFATDEAWAHYAIKSLVNVHTIARELGMESLIHLWPHEFLGERAVIRRQKDPTSYRKWLGYWQNRLSSWPAA